MVVDAASPSLNSCAIETAQPSVAIIVLNWNGRDDTLECLSTLRQLNYGNYEVIVVDNGSVDGSADAIRSAQPDLLLMETGCNLGYAGGNNVGIRNALKRGFDYVLLLNNDTLCPPEFLGELISLMKQRPEAAFAGPLIYYAQKNDALWSAGVRWNAKDLVLEHVLVAPIERDLSTGSEVQSLVGCALLARAQVIRQIGLLDEDFFLMHEESDWCYRAKDAGYKCFVAPRSRVDHKVSVSFGGASSPLMLYFSERNMLIWSSRHLPPLAFLRFALSRIWLLLMPFESDITAADIVRPKHLYWKILSSLRSPQLRARRAGLRDYVFRRFGDCPLWIRDLRSARS